MVTSRNFINLKEARDLNYIFMSKLVRGNETYAS